MTGGGAGALPVAAGGGGVITFTVVVSCLTAASGGLLLGYDISVTGGLMQMESFLQAFFPEILRNTKNTQQDAYCIFRNQKLTLFVSSLYLAGILSFFVSGHLTRTVGRRNSMLIGGFLFLAGVVLNFTAVNISMLVIGRILLGFAVGFTSLLCVLSLRSVRLQSAPVYLAEIAPARWRGAFTTCFHFFFISGMFMADMVNYGTNNIPRWGWRLSLGVGIVPAAVIIAGAALIPDTPNSLALRGRLDEARASLRRLRGGAAAATDDDIDAELEGIAAAVERDRRHASGALRRLFFRREYRPHLAIAVAAPVFFDLTGVIVVSIFTPLLFYTVGFTNQKAILGSILTDVVSLASIAVAGLAVDRVGRRRLLMLGGAVLVLSLAAMAWIFGAQLGTHGGNKDMPRGYATAVVALVCVYTAAFGASWGPLKWVVTSEIFPLEVRPAALGLGGAISGVLVFVQSESFLEMLCSFKYGAFLFYAGCVVVMVACVAVFLPETRGVPIESMGAVWEKHWYWKRYVVTPSSAPVPEPAKQADRPV
ncbi:unnamed protein product [Urochloa decumbens]|uniref:Major facilitator superfamily (MFS) profile domain-containing protein n=1 Tax=Urochloa decumbens TaxID=240449 RepID=A0ABC9CKI6_9POAL